MAQKSPEFNLKKYSSIKIPSSRNKEKKTREEKKDVRIEERNVENWPIFSYHIGSLLICSIICSRLMCRGGGRENGEDLRHRIKSEKWCEGHRQHFVCCCCRRRRSGWDGTQQITERRRVWERMNERAGPKFSLHDDPWCGWRDEGRERKRTEEDRARLCIKNQPRCSRTRNITSDAVMWCGEPDSGGTAERAVVFGYTGRKQCVLYGGGERTHR